MVKIVVGGQLEKDLIAEALNKYGGNKVDVSVHDDVTAAMMVQSGAAKYYFGACNTGGGGALAMAIALLTIDKCVSVTMPSSKLSEAKIKEAIDDGKIAFGFLADDVDYVVSTVLKYIL